MVKHWDCHGPYWPHWERWTRPGSPPALQSSPGAHRWRTLIQTGARQKTISGTFETFKLVELDSWACTHCLHSIQTIHSSQKKWSSENSLLNSEGKNNCHHSICSQNQNNQPQWSPHAARPSFFFPRPFFLVLLPGVLGDGALALLLPPVGDDDHADIDVPRVLGVNPWLGCTSLIHIYTPKKHCKWSCLDIWDFGLLWNKSRKQREGK